MRGFSVIFLLSYKQNEGESRSSLMISELVSVMKSKLHLIPSHKDGILFMGFFFTSFQFYVIYEEMVTKLLSLSVKISVDQKEYAKFSKLTMNWKRKEKTLNYDHRTDDTGTICKLNGKITPRDDRQQSHNSSWGKKKVGLMFIATRNIHIDTYRCIRFDLEFECFLVSCFLNYLGLNVNLGLLVKSELSICAHICKDCSELTCSTVCTLVAKNQLLYFTKYRLNHFFLERGGREVHRFFENGLGCFKQNS